MSPRLLLIPGVFLAVGAADGWAGAVTVRPDHPRILFSDGKTPGNTLATFKARCTTDAAYKGRCASALADPAGGFYPALGHAAAYLVGGDAARCTQAHDVALDAAKDAPGAPDDHSFISNNMRAMLQLGGARDWCDGGLTPAQKKDLEDRIVAWADWYVAHSPPDVFHDDMTNVWSAVAVAGLALEGTAQDAKAMGYLAAADTQWRTVILPAMAYAGDFWHEGFTYVQPTLGSLAVYAAAWSTATDDDVFAWSRSKANDLFEGYLRFHAYALRPDGNYVYFGDSSDNKQSVELFSRWLVDLLTLGTGSPLGRGLSDEIGKLSRPGYDYAGVNGWMPALLQTAGGSTARSSLPTARVLGKGAADVAVLRTGWGKDDMMVTVECGDWFSSHQRQEAGAFQIFQGTQLTGPSGTYDNFDSDHWDNYFSQHSVHADTLAIEMPGEFFPTNLALGDKNLNVNDGGQRTLRRDSKGTGYPAKDLTAYKTFKTTGTKYETGELTRLAADGCGGLYHYVSCDVTSAYTSPGFETNGNTAKVKEVTRQFVLVRPAGVPPTLFVFDRVEATLASYDKRSLVHVASTPTVTGASFSAPSGAGTLRGTVLLPADPQITVVDGFKVAGTAHPPTVSGRESWGTRLEISPKKESLRDHFLLAFPQGAVSADDAAQVTATSGPGGAGGDATVTFAKSGPTGGHIKIGGTTCDEDLGASGSAGGDDGGTGDGGSDGAGGATGDGGGETDAGNGDRGAGGSDSGCGCATPHQAAHATRPALLAGLGLAVAVSIRRRRRRRARNRAA